MYSHTKGVTHIHVHVCVGLHYEYPQIYFKVFVEPLIFLSLYYTSDLLTHLTWELPFV